MILTQKHLDNFIADAIQKVLAVYHTSLCSGDEEASKADERLSKGLAIIEEARERLQKRIEAK